MIRYITSETASWLYEQAPAHIDKCSLLMSSEIQLTTNPKGLVFGKDYFAWAPLLKVDKSKIEEIRSRNEKMD